MVRTIKHSGPSVKLKPPPKPPPPKASSSETTRKSALRAPEGKFVDTLIIVPPDGGWGWVVVFTSFFNNFIADGAMYTFSLFLKDLSKDFRETETKVVLANSLMTGFYFLCAPIVSALTNRYGFRVIGVAGGIFAAFAFIMSSFTTSITLFLPIYGVIGGFGFSMMYVPSVVIVGFYFERWRAIATAIAVSGSSAGILLFPVMIESMLNKFHWRKKFLFISGGCIMASLLALLYRPLHPVRVVPADDNNVQFILHRNAVAADGDKKVGCCKRHCLHFHNKSYPTTAELHGNESFMIAEPSRMSTTSVFTLVQPSVSRTSESTKSFLMRSVVSLDRETIRLETVYEDEEYKKMNCCRQCIYKANRFRCHCRNPFKYTASRPMYRDDIFYAGSLLTIPEYSMSVMSVQSSKKVTSLDYHLSVTRTATQKDLEQDYFHCVCCPESILRTLVTMLDMSLLKSPKFLLLAISGLLAGFGIYTPFVYVPQRAILNGMDRKLSYMLLSVLGGANLMGRLVSGLLSTIPNLNALVVSVVYLYIAGISTLLSLTSFNEIVQITYCLSYGFTIACVASIKSIIAVDLLGLEKLTNAFGILLTFQGLASLVGVPISAFLIEKTGNYRASFIFAGLSVAMSATLMVPIRKVANWEERKKEERQAAAGSGGEN